MDGKWGPRPAHRKQQNVTARQPLPFVIQRACRFFFFWVGRDVTCLDARLRVVVCVTAQTYWERRDIHKTLYAMHLVSLSLL